MTNGKSGASSTARNEALHRQRESWKQQFEELYSTENAVILPQMDPKKYNVELERPISLPELTKSVALQQNNKAPRLDAITN